MNLQEKVQEYIEEQHLFTPDQRLLIALSGGGDSMALLHIMLDLGYDFEVAHVNFKLRGAASDRDEAMVRQRCEELGVKLHFMQEDTEAYAALHRCSIEMAARDIRYDFFDRLITEHCLDLVLVAHHRDDVVETFFINLMRGTGLSGLSGISPLKGKVARPLLNCSHQELLSYLDERDLSYCTDHTNFDTAILRNKLRHDIIPEMEERKPGFGVIMQGTVGRLKEAEKLLVALVDEWRKMYTSIKQDHLYIDKDALYRSASPSEILFRLLQAYQFKTSIIDTVAMNEGLRVGARFYGGEYVLTVDRDYLVVSPITAGDENFTIEDLNDFRKAPLDLSVSIVNREQCHFETSSRVAYFDADLIRFPLTMRRWQQGDAFSPFGMQGKQKKVSDFFIDNKVSQPEKEAAWLLLQGTDILWVLAYRSDERFKVSTATQEVLRIEIL